TNLDALVWSTYIGGTSDDAGYAIKPSSNGNVYVTGGTLSTNFPVTAGTISNTNAGGADGFVISLSDANGALTASTYIGTNAYDQSYLIEIDVNDDVYIAGQTKGAYPVTGGVYSNPNSSQFIHKLNPGLTSTAFSTVFGKGSNFSTDISLTAFLVDNCQNIYVSGWGGLPIQKVLQQDCLLQLVLMIIQLMGVIFILLFWKEMLNRYCMQLSLADQARSMWMVEQADLIKEVQYTRLYVQAVMEVAFRPLLVFGQQAILVQIVILVL
ncbi:MAG: SBBP repeat-containing protein, partial [Bacteroidia bacterium]|nr:SBBP repeat-containing protein [Bacteroidia bacterium]